jgi:3-hydroxyacyl-CoA dehydrogenase
MAQKEIKKVGIVGAGTMGSGIAQLFALYDYDVVLVTPTTRSVSAHAGARPAPLGACRGHKTSALEDVGRRTS